MSAVRALARESGVTVCATIHSPSAYCFGLFDRLLVLARGLVVYSGPNGPAMVEFLQQSAPPRVLALLGQETYSNDAGGRLAGGRGCQRYRAATLLLAPLGCSAGNASGLPCSACRTASLACLCQSLRPCMHFPAAPHALGATRLAR
jgi:hypothetical protein